MESICFKTEKGWLVVRSHKYLWLDLSFLLATRYAVSNECINLRIAMISIWKKELTNSFSVCYNC